MAMVHLRVVCPHSLAPAVVETLTGRAGVVGLSSAPLGDASPDDAVIHADLARECADEALGELHRLGVIDVGLAALDPIDTAIGHLADKAERDAPGEGVDALIWDELVSRTGEDSTLTWTFAAFMVLATVLASIGVITDSPITIVGAMVVGPEFGPLAGLAVGLVRRRGSTARRAAAALLVGFPVAIVVTSLLALAGRVAGLIHVDVSRGTARPSSSTTPDGSR